MLYKIKQLSYSPAKHLLPVLLSVILSNSSFPSHLYAQPYEDNPILTKASTLLRAGDGKSAKSIYKEYLKLNPQSTDALLAMGRIAEREYQFPAARRYLEQAMTLSPNRADVAAEMGHLFHMWSVLPFPTEEDYHPRAEEFFRQAALINPDNPLYLTYLGDWQLDQGDTVSAERNFLLALQQNKTFVPAYQGLSRFYIRMKDLRRAKQTALHGLELDPENSDSYYLMARLLTLANHPEESIKYGLKSQLLDFGTLPDRDLLLAKEYERLGDLKNAMAYYEKINGYAPNQAPIVLKIGELAEMLGQEQKSITYLQRAYELDATIIEVWLDKAQTSLREEKVVDSITRFRRILVIKPGQEDALHGIASAHFLNAFYQQVNQNALQQDLARFDQNTLSGLGSGLPPLLEMDRIKMQIALTPGAANTGVYSENIRQALEYMTRSNNDLASGEALFLLGRYREAQERLDGVDGQTGIGYLRVGDRLLLDQELIMSAAMYQRGFQIDALPEIKQGLKRIEAKQKLADQKVQEGNLLFDGKQYSQAVIKYEQAAQIHREWETPYLRLGDTYQRLKQKDKAAKAFQQAVELNSSLLDSKGFSKKYKSLKKGS